jgi:hypothetical protein
MQKKNYLMIARNKKIKISPIKKTPLRTAGQSIDEEINRIKTEDLVPYIGVSVFMVGGIIFEWYIWITKLPPRPLAIYAAAIMVLAFSGYKISKYRKHIKNLKLALQGERAVGEYLNRFREKKFQQFHDVVAGNFNIDHILIGKKGIYTIETKTISKYQKGPQTIKYDGETVSINGYKPDRDPIIQAKAQANWVKDVLKDLTGKNFYVRPVVLYPGWFVDKQPRGTDVWVLNPKAIDSFIKNENSVIDEKLIPSISTHFSRYVRNSKVG